jgi:uncharacterized protein (DUF305 family)
MKRLVLLGMLWAGTAAAQMPGMQMGTPTPPTKPVVPLMPGAAPANGATPAYKDAMTKMMGGMDAPYADNADQDFVTHMMPHHQGAIDMAEIELKYGRDPRLKQLAARIISAQQREIAMMQGWLDKHPVKK